MPCTGYYLLAASTGRPTKKKRKTRHREVIHADGEAPKERPQLGKLCDANGEFHWLFFSIDKGAVLVL